MIRMMYLFKEERRRARERNQTPNFSETVRQWPFSETDDVEQSKLLEKFPELLSSIEESMDKATPEGTVESYRNRTADFLGVAGWKLGIENPFPLTPTTLLAYSAQVLNDPNRTAGPDTVKSYISSLVRVNLEGFGETVDRTLVNKFLKGNKNQILRDKELRKSDLAEMTENSIFSADSLDKMVRLGLRDSSWLEEATVVAVATLFFLRGDQARRLTGLHITVGADHIALIIPPSKYTQALTKPNLRIWRRTRHYLSRFGDIFELIKRYLEYRRKLLGNSVERMRKAPLFGKVFGRATFRTSAKKLTSVIRRLAAKIGIQHSKLKELSSHSCRRSGCAQALSIHAEIPRVQFHGCWKAAESMFPYMRIQSLPSDSAFHIHGHMLAPSTTALP